MLHNPAPSWSTSDVPINISKALRSPTVNKTIWQGVSQTWQPLKHQVHLENLCSLPVFHCFPPVRVPGPPSYRKCCQELMNTIRSPSANGKWLPLKHRGGVRLVPHIDRCSIVPWPPFPKISQCRLSRGKDEIMSWPLQSKLKRKKGERGADRLVEEWGFTVANGTCTLHAPERRPSHTG